MGEKASADDWSQARRDKVMMMVRLVKCPRCKKLTPYEENPHRPFCSERCKTRDLGAWATEEYVIEDKESELDEGNVSSEGKGSEEEPS